VSARFELAPGGALHLSGGAPPALAPLLAAWAERRTARSDEAEAAALGSGGLLAKDAPEKKEPVAEDVGVPAASPVPAPGAEGKQRSLYDQLQSLNRGAEGRAQRGRKLEVAAEPEAQAPSETLRVLVPPSAGTAQAAAEMPGRLASAPPVPPRSRPSGPRVAVDPLLGDRLDDGHLLLARTVLAGERGYRQGIVLEAQALGAWLRQRALGGDVLAGAALAFATPSGRPVPAPAAGALAHRFAEPFDALEASLSLPALPDVGSVDTVLRLSLLLVVAGGAGLFALYRMVAVALRFAEQRSNFVAAVSHELKTPLTAIRMYGEMLRDGLVADDAKRAEYYRTITAESERLSRLIDNVLEFARIERGERPLALQTGDLGAEVATLCDALRPHAAESGFVLEVAAPAGLPAVRFDRDALAQVLVNLVDNALKYARGATRREVGVECAPVEGGLALRVRDHGPGVAPRELGRVFELFHRGESELTRATRGTGLGLALVRSLTRRMGAEVSARNIDGEGFEVTIRFPLAPAAERAALTRMPSQSAR
jgi:signal transduction histidine kinase